MSVDLVLHFDPRGEVLAAARACEADVFLDHYGNTAEQWAHEYGPYDASSAFIAITEPGGDALAAMRIILPNPLGLKSARRRRARRPGRSTATAPSGPPA